jgi:hypothetical protein
MKPVTPAEGSEPEAVTPEATPEASTPEASEAAPANTDKPQESK